MHNLHAGMPKLPLFDQAGVFLDNLLNGTGRDLFRSFGVMGCEGNLKGKRRDDPLIVGPARRFGGCVANRICTEVLLSCCPFHAPTPKRVWMNGRCPAVSPLGHIPRPPWIRFMNEHQERRAADRDRIRPRTGHLGFPALLIHLMRMAEASGSRTHPRY